MPIDSVHPAYAANIAKWKRCRDAFEGEDAVKAAGPEYLPRLSGQDAAEYAAYKMRALYFEAVGRTVEGFVGAIARKEPVIKLPERLKALNDDVTGNGVGMLEFIKGLAAETLLEGRGGILADYDEAKGSAYLAFYAAECITNWTSDRIILCEQVCVPDNDPYKLKSITQYRELCIVEGQYTVNVWRQTTTGDGLKGDWYISEVRRPMNRGAALKEIPFVWLSPLGRTPQISKPPMLGLVNVALSHYRTSADLEHGRHFTGLPTLYVTGVTDTSVQVKVGSASALLLPEAQCKVGYAEFTGQGLGSLEKAQEDKERLMAALGAAVLQQQRKGVEAAETARIRTSGETSLLMGTVSAVEESLEAALAFAASWMGATGAIDIEINREFADIAMDPLMLANLVKAYQAGTISLETFLFNLEQSDMIPPERTIDEEATAARAQQKERMADAAAETAT